MAILPPEKVDVSLRLEFSFFSRAAAAKSLQSCPTLCNPIDGSPPGSPVPGILQARTVEWVAISFSNVWKEKWKWSRSVVSLSDPMDCSSPGSSVHGILQARVLEWGCHCLLLFPEQRDFFFFFAVLEPWAHAIPLVFILLPGGFTESSIRDRYLFFLLISSYFCHLLLGNFHQIFKDGK